jgi:hypothetical protein
MLLVAASLKLEESAQPIGHWHQLNSSRFAKMTYEERVESLLKETFRPARWTVNANSMNALIAIWVIGNSIISFRLTDAYCYQLSLRSTDAYFGV